MIRNPIWFRNLCLKNHFDISEEQIIKLEKYVELLLSWNQKINLISRRNPDGVWQQHIIVSISLLLKFQFYNNSPIVDIGTGGGLPGIPLAILCSSNPFVLIDSIQKKINAVKNIVDKLGLINVKVECGRAEDLSKSKDYKNKFDYAITRAVSSTENMVRWSKPFLINKIQEIESTQQYTGKQHIPRGTVLLLKGGDITDEINRTKVKLQPRSIQIYPILIDGLNLTELLDKKFIIIRP
ncbi:MAG: 16S rRNA (guanine(527)-N(7))-methyltransferase RsmG [Bacteroidota bacterium]|nr:16S rRNA (guanine(527)-N(7))-methyltransferase RsmG [Bacteroidota bacterium]